jgi:hypothetical protein
MQQFASGYEALGGLQDWVLRALIARHGQSAVPNGLQRKSTASLSLSARRIPSTLLGMDRPAR